MRTCPKCGERFSDQISYCNVCGVKLLPSQQPKTSTSQSGSYQPQRSSKSYTAPPSPYQSSTWITSLRSIYKGAFFAIIILGFIVCVKFCSDDMVGAGLLVLAGSMLTAVLSVGFVIVFLDIAGDIRDMVNYVYQIGSMMEEEKNKKQ